MLDVGAADPQPIPWCNGVLEPMPGKAVKVFHDNGSGILDEAGFDIRSAWISRLRLTHALRTELGGES